jgi:hypothetical protein
MKIKLLQVVIGVAIALFSVAALAGGAACDSMKGGHKDMTAEAMKEFKDSHGWMLKDGHDANHGKDAVKAAPEEGVPKVIKL